MDTWPVEWLVRHGLIILFLGVLAGFPYWIAIIRDWSEASRRSWRVAHAVLLADGLLLLVIGLILSAAGLPPARSYFVAVSLVASGYGFAWAFILGAASGHRALTPTTRLWDVLLFPGHFIGAVGSVLGLAALLWYLL